MSVLWPSRDWRMESSARGGGFHGTTILGVRSGNKVALGGDGQVSFGDTVVKHGARKIRRMFNNTVLAGFAGTVGDAHALLERFEGRLDEFSGNLQRAAVELAREWRTDRALRRLEALLAVMDRGTSLIISGEGDVIEPDDGIIALGAGGPYALAAARALVEISPNMQARTVVEKALTITASICVYTNDRFAIEVL